MNPEVGMAAIVREKTEQAVGVLEEQNVDLWLTLVRETSQVKDPVLDFLVGFDLTWTSALLLHRGGRRVAIVGRFDAPNVQRLGLYDEVVSYDESLKPALLEILASMDPRTIALNYSESDPAADGLTHGLFRMLSGWLSSTPYASRLISAQAIINTLRGRKTATEIARIQAAIEATQSAIAELHGKLCPDMADTEIANILHGFAQARGYGTAWDWEYCPAVTVGPESDFGHGMPVGLRTAPGRLVHVDFGILRDGYAADLQRTWYLSEQPGSALPAEVTRAWEAVTGALEAGRAALKPGVAGWAVDAAARSSLVGAGYPEFMHAFGHQVGRTAHDGGTVLGPQWERYGTSVQGLVEVGNVYAIELGLSVPGRGYVSREENVLVTEAGAEYLSDAQDGVWFIE
jgi:Xaa-Pro aminopeptidase